MSLNCNIPSSKVFYRFIIAVFSLLLFFGNGGIAVFAQNYPELPKEVKARLPEMLSRNIPPKLEDIQNEFRNGSGWGQDKRALDKPWIVYSDREQNPTYTSPDKTKRFGELKFGEKVCIADIKGDMALVYINDRASYPVIPNWIRSKGWVPMENLLLWNRCPVDQRGVQKKGFIAINLNKVSKNEKYVAKNYSSPDNLSMSKSLNPDMTLFYVMKETEDGEYALLCTDAQVNSAQSFYGWVNKNAFVEWNGRVCLEPNWDVQYNKNHNGEKVNTYFSANMDSCEIINRWEYGQSNGDTNPAYQYRMPPNMLRFPLLDINEEGNYAKCLYFFDRTNSTLKNDEHIDVAKNLKNYLGEKNYKDWLQIKAISLFEGYVPLVDDKEEDLWYTVLFLSRDELCQLLNELKPSYEIAKAGNDDRKQLINAIRNLVKAHSKLKSNKEIDRLDENQLQNLIYGIDINQEKDNRRKLKDIANPTIVTPIDYLAMLHLFCDNYEKLLVAYKDRYTYRVEWNGMYYYWIPIEELPFIN